MQATGPDAQAAADGVPAAPAGMQAATCAPRADAGLRCPRCEYNLTGLPEPRCPECGTLFDWAAVRAAAAQRPQIRFERARGWRKLPALPVTAAMVLLTPWIFARQAVRRMSVGHGLVFAAVCFASTLAALLYEEGIDLVAAWVTTGAIYLPIQAVTLSVLDFSGWRQPLRSAGFWLLAGCYTSAVMMTEFRLGPPLLFLSDVVALVGGSGLSVWSPGNMFEHDWRVGVLWVQLVLWLAGLACCYATRLRARGRGFWLTAGATALTVLVILVLYAAVIEHIGFPVGEWYFDVL